MEHYPCEMDHCVFKEHEVHAGASNHLVVLSQEHLEALLQRGEGRDGLVHLRHLHVQVFAFVSCWLGSISGSGGNMGITEVHMHSFICLNTYGC